MTDLKRHSEGYWRSVYIFAEIKDQYSIRDEVMKKLDDLGFEYSYCHYGEVLSSTPGVSEKAHISFRINFPDTISIETFKTWLKTHKWKWEDHNYDEPLWVKKAYVLGTRLFKEALKECENPDVHLNKAFFRLLFHGFFNNMGYSRKREIQFYHWLFDSMLEYVYNLSSEEMKEPT